MSDESSRALVKSPNKKRVTNATPRFFDGGKRSIAVLKANRFDPITKLIEQYNKLTEELKYWEDCRSNRIVKVLANGREVSMYNPDAHMAVYNLLVNIGDKLLRYGYGRVPENLPEAPNKPQALFIQLGKEGDVYGINTSEPEEDYVDAEIEDNILEDDDDQTSSRTE